MFSKFHYTFSISWKKYLSKLDKGTWHLLQWMTYFWKYVHTFPLKYRITLSPINVLNLFTRSKECILQILFQKLVWLSFFKINGFLWKTPLNLVFSNYFIKHINLHSLLIFHSNISWLFDYDGKIFMLCLFKWWRFDWQNIDRYAKQVCTFSSISHRNFKKVKQSKLYLD